MDDPKIQECAICSEERSAEQVWFLVAESHWEDKLKVLEWQDELAQRRGIYAACSGGHVEELVVHWMTTGESRLSVCHGWRQGGEAQTATGVDSAYSRRARRGARG